MPVIDSTSTGEREEGNGKKIDAIVKIYIVLF